MLAETANRAMVVGSMMAGFFESLLTKNDASNTDDVPHTVKVRDSETPTVDVRNLPGVEWSDSENCYIVARKIPPVKQHIFNNDPMLRDKMQVERRSDGMYITERTENADTAHALSKLMQGLGGL